MGKKQAAYWMCTKHEKGWGLLATDKDGVSNPMLYGGGPGSDADCPWCKQDNMIANIAAYHTKCLDKDAELVKLRLALANANATLSNVTRVSKELAKCLKVKNEQ